MKKIDIEDLGPARAFAEAASQGETVTIVGEDGHAIAHIIPASEPITEALVAELEERMPLFAGTWLRSLIGDPAARFIRAQTQVVFGGPLPPAGQ